jgi:hypothetical protein
MVELRVALDTDPQLGVAAALGEGADAGQHQGKAAPAQGRQCEVDLLGAMRRQFADEAQGHVIILGRHPARAGDAAAQHREALFQRPGQVEPDEQSHVGGTSASSFWTSGSSRATTIFTPFGLGWMWSAWLSAASPATPARKNGSYSRPGRLLSRSNTAR